MSKVSHWSLLFQALFHLLIFSSHASLADTPVLRWGADIESGAPYSFKDPKDPSRIIGFEAEIVAALGDELGMTVEFFQNNWEGLVEGLKRGDYDLVVNGLEITEDRRQTVKFSRPYLITSEILAVRKDNDEIKQLSGLKDKKVGTLTGSLAQRILNEQTFPMNIVTYSEEVHVYSDLAMKRLDAVLLDTPIALYYGQTHPDLKLVGSPLGQVEYGIATRIEHSELSRKIDQALGRLIKNGRLQEILEKWGLWNEVTAKSFGLTSFTTKSQPNAYQEYLKSAWKKKSWTERFNQYVSFLPILAKGAWMTLKISLLSMIVAMALGLGVALVRLYGIRPFNWLALAFVEVFRGTPLLIQLFLIFYGLPHLGIRLDAFVAAVVGLGLNYAACEAENYRAGILAIPKAQFEASQALGMSWRQSLRHIVLPQAIRVVIPPVTNDFIALLKDSSLVSVITMVELTATYGQLASTHFDYLGIGLLTAAVYFLIGLPFVRLSRYFEKHLKQTQIRQAQKRKVRTDLAR